MDKDREAFLVRRAKQQYDALPPRSKEDCQLIIRLVAANYKTGRSPTTSELFAQSGLPRKRFDQTLKFLQRTGGIEASKKPQVKS